MNHLSLRSLSFCLFTMLAAAPTAAAQIAVAGDEAPASKEIKLSIAGVDFAVVLLSLEPDRIALPDGDVLSNAMVAFADQDGYEFCVTLLDADLEFYWQSLAIDGTGLRLGAISRVAPHRPKANVLPSLPGDFAVVGDAPATTPVKDEAIETPVKDDLAQTPVKSDLPPLVDADAAAPPSSKADGTILASDLPITVRAKTSEIGLITSVHFWFLAPTDGYGLGLVAVEGGRPKGHADIYLYRKLPGEGEGLYDMQEEHRLAVELPKCKTARVFLAEGKTTRPGSDVTWREFVKL